MATALANKMDMQVSACYLDWDSEGAAAILWPWISKHEDQGINTKDGQVEIQKETYSWIAQGWL